MSPDGAPRHRRLPPAAVHDRVPHAHACRGGPCICIGLPKLNPCAAFDLADGCCSCQMGWLSLALDEGLHSLFSQTELLQRSDLCA